MLDQIQMYAHIITYNCNTVYKNLRYTTNPHLSKLGDQILPRAHRAFFGPPSIPEKFSVHAWRVLSRKLTDLLIDRVCSAMFSGISGVGSTVFQNAPLFVFFFPSAAYLKWFSILFPDFALIEDRQFDTSDEEFELLWCDVTTSHMTSHRHTWCHDVTWRHVNLIRQTRSLSCYDGLDVMISHVTWRYINLIRHIRSLSCCDDVTS